MFYSCITAAGGVHLAASFADQPWSGCLRPPAQALSEDDELEPESRFGRDCRNDPGLGGRLGSAQPCSAPLRQPSSAPCFVRSGLADFRHHRPALWQAGGFASLLEAKPQVSNPPPAAFRATGGCMPACLCSGKPAGAQPRGRLDDPLLQLLPLASCWGWACPSAAWPGAPLNGSWA